MIQEACRRAFEEVRRREEAEKAVERAEREAERAERREQAERAERQAERAERKEQAERAERQAAREERMFIIKTALAVLGGVAAFAIVATRPAKSIIVLLQADDLAAWALTTVASLQPEVLLAIDVCAVRSGDQVIVPIEEKGNEARQAERCDGEAAEVELHEQQATTGYEERLRQIDWDVASEYASCSVARVCMHVCVHVHIHETTCHDHVHVNVACTLLLDGT